MPAPKGNKNGKRFSATRQPKNPGRKPSRMNEFIKAFNLEDESRQISREDATKLLVHLLGCNKAQLELMARNQDLPVSIVCQILAIVDDIANKKTDTVDKIADRLYGKSMQPLELTGAQGSPLIPTAPMSRKGYEALLNKLKCGA